MAALPRLSDMLSNGDSVLTYRLSGAQEGDRFVLRLILKGESHLRCQRCMGDFVYPLDLISRLQLVTAEELEALDSDDSIDGIEADSKLDVLALVEDEVLLGLPFAPKHPEGACGAFVESLKKLANPFAVLASLKMKQ